MADLVTRERAELLLAGECGPTTSGDRQAAKTIVALYDENAELRRWLGAAAKEVRAITRHSIGYESVDASVFDAISRGEPVSEDVRRMYLGDEE